MRLVSMETRCRSCGRKVDRRMSTKAMRQGPISKKARPDFDVMTVIGMNWFVPIERLLLQLEQHAASPPNDFQTSFIENGLSAGVALLSAVLFESFIRRAQVLQGAGDFFVPVEEYF